MSRQLRSQYGDANNCVRAMTAGISGGWTDPTLICSGDFVSNDNDGFTISWTLDITQDTSILYISMGDAPTVSILGGNILGCTIL